MIHVRRIRVYPSVTPERYAFHVTLGSTSSFCDALHAGLTLMLRRRVKTYFAGSAEAPKALESLEPSPPQHLTSASISPAWAEVSPNGHFWTLLSQPT